jgi:diaminohydroxyphosphoribosylaminopyrimidine deaminase / 5-amino-6-(5-phosphoribosylamino)uracil reductase
VENHEKFMRRCLFLAKQGLGNTAPNPMVGAVIVVDNKIIGEGFTSPYGGPHAEVNAVASVENKELLKTATLYVSLEPCAHFGKTPPCSHLITHVKIPKVVIGTQDTFSQVNGKGIEHLKTFGVDVISGVLEKECRELNKRFFTFQEKKRPYIILKWAQTQDGFMDRERRDNNQTGVNWITACETTSMVHLWRSQEMGILVGRQTIENDNPSLNVRLVKGKNPIRIVLDPNNEIELSSWTSAPDFPTLIFCKDPKEAIGNIEFIALHDFRLGNILSELYERNIQSVLVEGGAFTLNQFLQENLWDEARVLTGNKHFYSGILAPVLSELRMEHLSFGEDQLSVYRKF